MADAPDVPPTLFQTVLKLFSAAGEVAVIPEGQMDDIINVNGSSPAWFFRMAEVMVQRAVSVGIDAGTALRLTAKTMEGCAKMLQESGKTPGGAAQAGLLARRNDAGLSLGLRRDELRGPYAGGHAPLHPALQGAGQVIIPTLVS